MTWFSLDEGDNDPVKFWAYFIASLQGLKTEISASILSLLQSPQSPPITSILTALVNDITAFEDMFAIDLDDYHVIDSQPIHDALTFLIDHLPKNMHLVMTTRVDPPLPLARIRAHDDLTELRANELRFTLDETAEFLKRVMGLNISAEEVAALEARTEGWIAGLQIAALSMQDHEDVLGFIQSFSGSHRHILGYLAEEVLNRQSTEILNFLLQTSILDRLCGPLCDAVTGESGGQAIIENLAHANLFIMPLDDEGRWYRYHHLFAEVLQARLQKNLPDQVSELHRRAGDWYARQGLMEDAIHHELNSSNFEDSARLIARIAPAYIQRGESNTVLNWIDDLPEEQLFNNADLLSFQGWLLYVAGRVDEAKRHIEKSQAYLSSDTASVARGRLAYLASQFAIADGNMETVNTYARQALELIGEEDFFFRILTLMTVAGVQTLAGNTRDAISNLREAARIGERSGQPLPTLTAKAKLTNLLNLHGELQEGRAICKHAMNLYIDSFGKPLPISSIAFVEAAKLAYEEDDLDVLGQYIHTAIMQEELLEIPGLAFEIMYINSLFEMAKGNADAALDFARQGKNSAEQMSLIGYVSIFAALEANLMVRMGNFTQVESWIKSTNLLNAGNDNLLLFHV